jgi:hypothetical protein
MLLSRDFVAYMAKEVVKRLEATEMIETKSAESVALNEEVREILSQHAEEMRRTGVSYQEMYKKVKGELARQRKLTLR